jgi:hypothetical protein
VRGSTLGAALFGAVVITGCGGSSPPSGPDAARAAVKRYFEAVAAQQPQAACAQLTTDSQQRLAEFAKPLRAGDDTCTSTMRAVLSTTYGKALGRLAGARILNVAIHGKTAVAAVDGVDKPLQLSLGSAGWRIEFTPSVEADKLPGATPDNGKEADSGG